MAIQISFLLLTEATEISLDDLRAEISTNWPDVYATDFKANEGGPISFQWGEATIFLQLMKAPIPWSDLEGPCTTSLLWPKAEGDVKSHKGHYLITIMAEPPPVEMSSKLTVATAIALGACSTAFGVSWSNSSVLVPKDMFSEFARMDFTEEKPIYIWVDFRVGSGDPSGSSGFTQGMTELGLMEFEAQNVPESVGDLRDRLYGLVAYVIDNGPVIGDGDTIGRDANEKIHVCYEPSIHGHDNQVMRLRYGDPVAPAAKKPGWKFW
jgi:Domain of unknown function (DUF4261)